MTANFATITSTLGVQTCTTTHSTRRAAEMAARQAIRSGAADSAAVWTATEAVAFFGQGR